MGCDLEKASRNILLQTHHHHHHICFFKEKEMSIDDIDKQISTKTQRRNIHSEKKVYIKI